MLMLAAVVASRSRRRSSTSSMRRSKRLGQAMHADPYRSEIIAAVGSRCELRFLCLCSACVQGPDYTKPTVEVPPLTGSRGSTGLRGQQSEWWKAYRDPRLDSLVQEALVNNRDLRVAAARVDEFDAILAGTRSQGRRKSDTA